MKSLVTPEKMEEKSIYTFKKENVKKFKQQIYSQGDRIFIYNSF